DPPCGVSPWGVPKPCLTPLGQGNPCPAWAVAPHAAPPPRYLLPFPGTFGCFGCHCGVLGPLPSPEGECGWWQGGARAGLCQAPVPAVPPPGTRSPGDSPEVAQRRRDALGNVGTDPMGSGQGCAPHVPPVCPPGPAAASPPPLSPGRWLQGLGLGWRYHGGRIYYFSWGKKPWREAREFCLSRQAQLTSITSWDEQEFLARESRGGSYWIGLEDGGPNDTWRWVDGTAFWAPGQPDRQQHGQQGREGCAQIHPVGTGLWNDHNCNVPFLWICKRGLGGP
uniref:C-type lectin domain-containing protein n=1 Tax=Anas platyrhynchos TaxID=8839 RepID=A0A8B9TF94_ANAPL